MGTSMGIVSSVSADPDSPQIQGRLGLDRHVISGKLGIIGKACPDSRQMGTVQGDRFDLCKAPFGPFRQTEPVPIPVPANWACPLLSQIHCCKEYRFTFSPIRAASSRV